ncbi:MAG: polymer-forming cytoskeletal protein [Alphaproteobacteria bacterium]|nr:polymer-forming cytoskeletal protein [Alphaproteobacteria bacterium]
MSNSVHNGGGTSSFVGSGLRVNGDVICDGDIQIEGVIVGDVKSRSLNLGESGEVRGEVVADQVQVGGKVVGQIKARSVNLLQSARVEGDILHETLSVEAGAFIEGAIRRITTKEIDDQSASGKVSSIKQEPKPAATGQLPPKAIAGGS